MIQTAHTIISCRSYGCFDLSEEQDNVTPFTSCISEGSFIDLILPPVRDDPKGSLFDGANRQFPKFEIFSIPDELT